MSHKKPRKPSHYNKKNSSRTKPFSDVSLRFALEELTASGYEVVTTDNPTKNRKVSILAMAWIQKDFPDAVYSNSGRTIKMTDKFGTSTISVPVSDPHLSKDAVKDLRARTGLKLNPEAEDDADESYSANDNDVVPMGDKFAGAAEPVDADDAEDDDFDWEDDDVYVVIPDATTLPAPEVKKPRTVTRTRRPRDTGPSV